MYLIILMLGNETLTISSINIRHALIHFESHLLVRRKNGSHIQSHIKNEIVSKRHQYKITILT